MAHEIDVLLGVPHPRRECCTRFSSTPVVVTHFFLRIVLSALGCAAFILRDGGGRDTVMWPWVEYSSNPVASPPGRIHHHKVYPMSGGPIIPYWSNFAEKCNYTSRVWGELHNLSQHGDNGVIISALELSSSNCDKWMWLTYEWEFQWLKGGGYFRGGYHLFVQYTCE